MSSHHRQRYHNRRGPEDPCEVRAKFVTKDLHEKNETRFLEVVQTACQIHDNLVDLSTSIKQTMDETYGPTWHVVVGPNFASHIMHEKRAFAHIKCNNLSFLIYKYG
ncbi:Dynein light chain 1, cytoplasmic [Echinococcus granulosus]|uniref:Dynein light chain n=1 Tax=Echinococcus granulosus TaxID=6210 RepID=U6IZK7_ECHGR|nr:Dynein light chain 1, cytoplasmic [Echinococcus granulosus]EUB64452.1 Dynein light chain 1, cytoplasmic [Echinococcus granulosus]KAH9282788.1 Dynein light chain 1, cytoplasmic [Echinococcus granulosus]CDS17174.1 dynein light chain [Echinococcus granulosus]